MDAHRWTLLLILPALIALPGCMADQVVYVDQHGNELAVDASGQPIIPGRAPDVTSAEPPVVAWEPPAPAPVAMPERRPVAAQPARTPDWDAPAKTAPPAPASSRSLPAAPVDSSAIDLPPAPAGAAVGAPRALPESKAKAPAKADSSSELDGPPAG